MLDCRASHRDAHSLASDTRARHSSQSQHNPRLLKKRKRHCSSFGKFFRVTTFGAATRGRAGEANDGTLGVRHLLTAPGPLLPLPLLAAGAATAPLCQRLVRVVCVCGEVYSRICTDLTPYLEGLRPHSPRMTVLKRLHIRRSLRSIHANCTTCSTPPPGRADDTYGAPHARRHEKIS